MTLGLLGKIDAEDFTGFRSQRPREMKAAKGKVEKKLPESHLLDFFSIKNQGRVEVGVVGVVGVVVGFEVDVFCEIIHQRHRKI